MIFITKMSLDASPFCVLFVLYRVYFRSRVNDAAQIYFCCSKLDT